MRLAEAVEVLAVQVVEGARSGEGLLDQLRTAVGSSAGRTRSRASDPATRVPINVAAFTLWEDVSGQIASVFAMATEQRPDPDPVRNLLGWFVAFESASQRGETTLIQHEVASERVEGWAARIRALLDAPIVKELTFECPVCGERFVVVGHGEEAVRYSALTVTYRPGSGIEAACGKCRTRWVGKTEVVHLGRRAGVPIDLEAIRSAAVGTAEPRTIPPVGVTTSGHFPSPETADSANA